MTTEQPNYHAYLLRLWRVDLDRPGVAAWRASLEDPHTGLRLGFATLEQLFAYLMEVSEGTDPPTITTSSEEVGRPPA